MNQRDAFWNTGVRPCSAARFFGAALPTAGSLLSPLEWPFEISGPGPLALCRLRRLPPVPALRPVRALRAFSVALAFCFGRFSVSFEGGGKQRVNSFSDRAAGRGMIPDDPNRALIIQQIWPLLGCINASDSESRHFSSSPRFAYFCTVPNSTFVDQKCFVANFG